MRGSALKMSQRKISPLNVPPARIVGFEGWKQREVTQLLTSILALGFFWSMSLLKIDQMETTEWCSHQVWWLCFPKPEAMVEPLQLQATLETS